MGRHLRFLLITILGIVAFGEVALAYPTPVDFDGSILRWDIDADSPPITYEIKADRQDDALTYQGAVEDAVDLWNGVPASYFAYDKVGPEQKAQVTIHLQSVIDGGQYSAGYAIFDEYEGTKPSHCSIYVSADDGIGYMGMAKTFLHELGHCLGLGHSLVPQSIMSYKLEENSFALDVDDQAAVSRLYPADGSKPKLPPGCAVGPERAASPGTLLALLLTPLVALIPSLLGRQPRPERTRTHSPGYPQH
jgi:hypothetical protein